ncbi:MAG: undecaprenyldiphospho-muramoylpentapeptide beta-N-acetylglucosaminyltransferase [Thermodesulfobacteriota bacterium]
MIAGGGTGGHLFPGLATARELTRRYPDGEILFVTGERRMETRILEKAGYRRVSIDVQALKGRGWKGGLATLLGLPRSFFEARRIVGRFSPGAVLGVGGYSSGPVCVAARTLDVPTAIHEQNSIPGLTNRLLSRIVDRVFISFEESRDRFPGGIRVFTGNPVREELLDLGPGDRRTGGPLSLLVVGGSQGARAVNTAVAYALLILKHRGRTLRVVHQTGEYDYERVLRIYSESGLEGVVTPFIDDMARAYRSADLVVGRAGASTVTELAAMGKPSILVPFPYAADDHQTANARALSEAGGAVLLPQRDLSATLLADLLEQYDEDRERLARAASRAREKGRPEAARAIVDQLETLMGLESPGFKGGRDGHETLR